MRIPHILVATVLVLAAWTDGETVVLDFDDGLDCNVLVINGMFVLDSSQGNIRLAKDLSSPGFNQAKVWALYRLIGDFEVTVDFGLFTFPHPETFNNQIQLDASCLDGSGITFLIARQKGLLGEPGVYEGPIDGYTAFNTGTGVTAAEPGSSDTTGSMRIARNGANWSFWYLAQDTGTFTLLDSLSGPTDDVLISMDLQNNQTGDALDAAFDNLVLWAETVESIGQPDLDGDGTSDSCDDDIDGDGILNEPDVCDYTPLGANIITDPQSPFYGTLRGDLDGDCDCDLTDYAILQDDFTGPGVE